MTIGLDNLIGYYEYLLVTNACFCGQLSSQKNMTSNSGMIIDISYIYLLNYDYLCAYNL
jgi:hypothetical protein